MVRRNTLKSKRFSASFPHRRRDGYAKHPAARTPAVRPPDAGYPRGMTEPFCLRFSRLAAQAEKNAFRPLLTGPEC